MRHHNVVRLILICAIPAVLGAQTQTTPAPAAQQPASQSKSSATTLTGCVVRSLADDTFTLSDVKNGTYELKGL